MACPVIVQPDIAYRGQSFDAAGSAQEFPNDRVFATGGVEVKDIFPYPGKKTKVNLMSRIFLGDLPFHQMPGFLKGAKEGGYGFPNLKIHRTEFYLQ